MKDHLIFGLVIALLVGAVVGLVATSFYFISMTTYPYTNVVGGFTLLGATIGFLVGVLQDV